jgi:hypothetical protein
MMVEVDDIADFAADEIGGDVEDEDAPETGEDWAFDWDTEEFFGDQIGNPLRVTGEDAVIEWAEKALRTPKGAYAIYCADPRTEVLSEAEGWITHDVLRPGMRVLTLDHERGVSEWQPVSAVHRFEVQEEMLELRTGQLSALTTMDHRWPTHRRFKNPERTERFWATSAELTSHDRIITAAPHVGLPEAATFSDDLVEAVAWFYTEGYIRRAGRSQQLSMCQSDGVNPGNVIRMRSALEGLFGPPKQRERPSGTGVLDPPRWREQRARGRDIVSFWLNTTASSELLEHAPDKVPQLEWIRALTSSQLELFAEVSFAADGWTKGPTSVIAQKDPRRLDALELALILLGRTPHRYDSRSGMAMLSVGQARHRTLQRVARRRRPYTGVVWCPTTANRTWLARRDGCVYFTGNSDDYGSELQALIGQPMPEEARAAEIERAVEECLTYHPRIADVVVEEIGTRPDQPPDALFITAQIFIDDGVEPVLLEVAA